MRATPEAASAWLSALPEDKRPQPCIRTLAQTLAYGDLHNYEAARVWAGMLTDESVRTSTYNGIFTEWGAADPDAALSALEKTPMSDAARAELLDALERNRAAQ